MKIFWAAGFFLLTAGGVFAARNDSTAEMLSAYSDLQYPKARKLANKFPDKPESRLVKALCTVFDRKKQDLQYGLPELGKIYKDEKFPGKLRLQAGLAYARAAQTLQMREGVYSVADGIDFQEIFDSIIKKYPNSPEACFAVIYQAQSYFESADKAKKLEGIKLLKSFLKKFKGPRKYLSGINILLANEYILIQQDYSQAVKCLVNAWNDGISNPRTAEIVLFRIARSYDLKLKNAKDAIKYYKMFLKEFPNCSSAPVAKRHLKKLEAKK